jgi:hypothetical protein
VHLRQPYVERVAHHLVPRQRTPLWSVATTPALTQSLLLLPLLLLPVVLLVLAAARCTTAAATPC